MDNGPYELEVNFHYVFDVNHNNGPETILAYQVSVDASGLPYLDCSWNDDEFSGEDRLVQNPGW